jgi:ankyrin repeat protein
MTEITMVILPFHYAYINQHSNRIELLLQHGANITVHNNTKVTPSYFAGGCFGKLQTIRLLLESGANYEFKDDNGKSPSIIL